MKKSLITFAVLTVVGTPAFAQSFNPDLDSGTLLPVAYRSTAPHNNMTGARQSGPSWFARDPGSPSAGDPDSPELTGGGSLGYNRMQHVY